MKVLYADSSGLWCSKKSFTNDYAKTNLKFLSDPRVSNITQAELAMVLEGAAFEVINRPKNWPSD
jgi:hypothetical protein